MRLYITGGGTGGHVTPGLAIARYFEHKHPDTVVRFAGSARGIENKLVPREGYPLDAIEIIGMSRSLSPKGVAHNIKAAKLAVSAISKAKKLLRQARPDCVIGCGGYASFAVVRAAQQMGIPTVLLEVNALPGKVTKMLSKKADRVLVCFEQAKEILGGGDKVVLTGAPVRGEILSADREKARARFGLTDQDQMVVSFWGSMGAKYMNEHMAGGDSVTTLFFYAGRIWRVRLRWSAKMTCRIIMYTQQERRHVNGCRVWRKSRVRIWNSTPTLK